MARPIRDIRGEIFGRLTVQEHSGKDKRGNALWLCLCQCGNKVVRRGTELTRHRIPSCGCFAKELGQRRHNASLERKKFEPPKIDLRIKHGLTNSRVYTIWCAMKNRCLNKKGQDYAYYGGRGITIDERWYDFLNFLEDMGHPADGMTLERINNDDSYSPTNCRWATRKEQCYNQRSNVVLSYENKNLTIGQWADLYGMKYMTLYSRIDRGMPIEIALTRPLGRWIHDDLS